MAKNPSEIAATKARVFQGSPGAQRHWQQSLIYGHKANIGLFLRILQQNQDILEVGRRTGGPMRMALSV
jgi:hypothetical protein